MLKLYWYRALELFSGKTSPKKNVEAEFGELLVTGRDKTEINLPYLPRVIEVKFKDREHHVPCNMHHDKLEYEICRHHHEYKLIIEWHVGNMREISWIVYF